MTFFDWSSIKANLISDIIFFVFTLATVPAATIYFIKKRNRKSLILKFSYILLEFCDFLSYTMFRSDDLNSEQIAIFTARSRIKEHKFVALSIVNVFSPRVYPLIKITIHDTLRKRPATESFSIIKEELNKLKELRTAVEQILAAHSLHLDESILLRISQLCLEIRKLEIANKTNLTYEELSEANGLKMEGVFGEKELWNIYTTIFELIRDTVKGGYFEFKITKQ